ncbi:MAG TPA: response regulator [Nannocystaceae bacterium]|nr:response regulator [Nannocystaceae bacterium]
MDASPTMSPAPNEEPVNILLVDDQPAKLLAYEAILGDLGETLVKANSAREALEFLLRNDVAVVLIDVHMPELDGFELAAMIREHPRYQRIAIVFVSAVHMTDLDRLRGYRNGAVDYVSVPIVPEILRAKVTVFVDLHRKSRQLEALNRELESRVEERTAELRASASELRVSEERLNLALDSAGAAAWDWDAIEDRLDWMPRFRELHGFTADDPPQLGTVLARVTDDDRDRLTARVQRMLSTPGDDEWNEEFRINHPSRGVRDISGLGRAFRDGFGRVVRMTGIDLDVTERVETERALKEADRRKDEFLATLSHELRNPLAPILNAVQLLGIGGVGEDDRARMHAIIHRQVLHMVRLVDDLLDVSRITSGKIALQRERLSVDTVIARALETCAPLVDGRGLRVVVHTPDAPLEVDGDATRLVQVVANLLNNAAKFSEPGNAIEVSARREGNEAVLAIKDSGIGIDETMLPRVFELFTQMPVSGQRVGGGLGIGLAIVRQLVQMHGGSVTAFSRGRGHGSEFVVRLPLPSHAREAEPEPERPPQPNGQPRRIVVADDNEDVLEMLSWVLSNQGHEVRIARDGVEAVAAAEAMRPHVVILDIGMPNLDGYGAAKRIREQPWGATIKLIAQTGWGQPDDKRRASEAGFDLHLTKPIDMQRLAEALADLDGR